MRKAAGSLVDRIKTDAFLGLCVTSETQRSECLDANAFTAQPVCAHLISFLQEGESHALGFFTGQ